MTIGKSQENMRLKRASSLIITYEPQGIVVHNFLTKDIFVCNSLCIDFLSKISQWKTLDTIYKSLASRFTHEQIKDVVRQLLENNALVIQNSKLEELDNAYSKEWEWGSIAGFYHFSIRNAKFLAGTQQRQAIRKRRKEKPEPDPIKNNNGYQKKYKLPEFQADNHLFQIMSKRRSKRNFKSKEISLSALADCLYSAKGISKWVKDEDFGTLPLTMTPSGGARNPYDLYLYARAVTNLRPGFYHYCGQTHDLGLVNNEIINPSDILANQKWANDAAAIIFLTANFNRTAWKYHLAPAYRIVLIEAGFIGQNIALSATHHGLSAIPTGAVSEKRIETFLQLKPVTEAHILSMVIGNPISEQQ